MTITTVMESESTSSNNNNNMQSHRKQWQRFLRPCGLFGVYLVGVLWHGYGHAHLSVTSGGGAKRWYIDENSLEPSHLRIQPVDAWQKLDKQAVAATADPCMELSCCCHYSTEQWKAMVVTPTPVVPVATTEAIVFIMDDTILARQLVHRLSQVPWLSKTVIVVTPSSSSSSVAVVNQTLVNSFWHTTQTASPPPRCLTGFLIRQLIVLTTTLPPNTDDDTVVRILPTGRHGLLPNMDLVWVTAYLLRQALRSKQTIVMHPALPNVTCNSVPQSYRATCQRIVTTLGFVYGTTISGKEQQHNPHATVLEQGVDALTIQATATVPAGPVLELLVRALGNLHERLHHSTRLYLLTSATHYLPHEEFLIPNLLLVIPALIFLLDSVLQLSETTTTATTTKGSSTVLIQGANAAIAWETMVTMVGATLLFSNVAIRLGKSGVMLWMVLLHMGLWQRRRQQEQEVPSNSTVQWCSSLVLLAIHVPLAFGHLSLCFPSALLWTPAVVWGGGSAVWSWISLVVTTAILVFWTYEMENGDCPSYLLYGYVPLYVLVAMRAASSSHS